MKTINNKGIEIAHILAISANQCIGINNDLPWHISEDLQHFKQLTQGGVLVLGRKCYDSFGGRPLPNRSHWVVTRNENWDSGFENTDKTQVHSVTSIEIALEKAIEEAINKQLPTVWIIGGAQIYAQTKSLVNRIEVTYVHTHVAGDVFYPELSADYLADFDVNEQAVKTDKKSGLDFQFVSYRKKQSI